MMVTTYMLIIWFDMRFDNSTVPIQVTLIPTLIRTRTLIRALVQTLIRIRTLIRIPIQIPIRIRTAAIRTAAIRTGKSAASTSFNVYLLTLNFLV